MKSMNETKATLKLLRSVKANRDKVVVFIGETCAIHDGDIAHSVSRAAALFAVKSARLSFYSAHSNGETFAA